MKIISSASEALDMIRYVSVADPYKVVTEPDFFLIILGKAVGAITIEGSDRYDRECAHQRLEISLARRPAHS